MHVSILDPFQHLNSDLPRTLKVKCDGGTGPPIYDFLLVFNSNIAPNSAPLRDMGLQNLSDLDFDLSRSLKVKCDCLIGLHIWFPTNIYSNHMSISRRLALIATQNVFSYLLSLRCILKNRKCTKSHSTLQSKRHPVHILLVLTTPKFHSVLLYGRSFSI